jgi:hypothetical protein
MNARILNGLPINRKGNSVYFKSASTSTSRVCIKAPFCFVFDTEECAREFEALWFMFNGKIEDWKGKDAKKKPAGNSKPSPLGERTNSPISVRPSKRKATDPIGNNPFIPVKKRSEGDGEVPLIATFFECVAEVRDSPKFIKILRIEIANYPIIIRTGMYCIEPPWISVHPLQSYQTKYK